jgi:hypothetical protein
MVEKEMSVHGFHVVEDHVIALYHIEAMKKCSKSHYVCHVQPCLFHEGYLVLVYDQAHDTLDQGKFESLWKGLYVIK